MQCAFRKLGSAGFEVELGRIVLYELRGNLFFARAGQLFEELMPDLEGPVRVILDLYRVSQVDLSSIKILEQAVRRLARHGGELIFCEVYRSQGLGREGAKTLRKLGLRGVQALLGELGEPPAGPAQR